MSKVISLFNMSGGVGKSTLTMNLSYHLTTDLKKKVLLVDMDPQASLTTFMGFNPFDLEKTVFESLLNKEPLPILKGVVWCDIVPANIFLSRAELKLSSELRREYRLQGALEEVQDNYDVILIDCPPSLGLLSINCLVASNYLLIPIQTEYKSVEATLTLLRTTYEIARDVNKELQIIGAVPTMFDERTSQARRALQAIHGIFKSMKSNKFFADAVVFPPIPRRTDFANAVAEHEALAVHAPKHDALKILIEISEGLGRLL